MYEVLRLFRNRESVQVSRSPGFWDVTEERGIFITAAVRAPNPDVNFLWKTFRGILQPK
jgi:hypothetical protein